jgi:hypothetical protein
LIGVCSLSGLGVGLKDASDTDAVADVADAADGADISDIDGVNTVCIELVAKSEADAITSISLEYTGVGLSNAAEAATNDGGGTRFSLRHRGQR